MKNNQNLNSLSIICFTIFFLFNSLICKSQTADPGISGPYSVLYQDYDLGDLAYSPPTFPSSVEVIGRVFYPSDLTAGPFPVLIFLHGRHSTCYNPSTNGTSSSWPCTSSYDILPSYQGYDYLAEFMAGHGYIVISISANAINATDNDVSDFGMRARGELVQHHLNLWQTYNSVGGSPFGTQFVGKLDLDRVGTMGHSRGGEGVVEHALLNNEQGNPYGIKAVLTLAPVDFGRKVLNGIPLMNIAPYCDGDVSNLQGIHYFDDARYNDANDEAPKHSVLILGANHNFFNTIWTPGQFPAGASDDWGYEDMFQNDSHCGTNSSSNQRLSSAQQRAALITYLSAFFRVYVGNETQFLPILQTEDIDPPVSSGLDASEVFVSFHPAKSKRLEINRLDNQTCEILNSLTDDVGFSGLTNYSICSGYCLDEGTAQEPHGSSSLSLSQLQIGWNSSADEYTNDIPEAFRNFTQFNSLQFRLAVNFISYTGASPLNFTVQLIDSYGFVANQQISEHSNALYSPPGTLNNTLPKLLHNTISIPVSSFEGIDLSSVEQIKFLFNQSVSGSIMVSDIILNSENDLIFPPLANFSSNVNETCTGEVNFTDQSGFNPTSWFWDFGDGTTSTMQNPYHFYPENGTYTVKLSVENSIGNDSIIKTSYISVNKPEMPFCEGDTICGEGEVNLVANSSSAGLLYWFNELGSTSSIATGSSYSTVINETTSFFVEELVESPLLSVGPVDNSFGSGGNFNSNDLRGIFFDAYDFFTLETVKVYSNSAGTRTIEVLSGDGGSVIHTANVYVGAGEQVVSLGFNIEPYSGYYLKVSGSLIDFFRINDGSPDYPYTIPGLVSLTGSNVDGQEQDFYYYFFDWKVKGQDCISERAEVIANVYPLPEIIVSEDVEIYFGETTVLSATGGESYQWWPSEGLNSTIVSSPEASPDTTTQYWVLVTNEFGCSDTAEITVSVLPLSISENMAFSDFQVFPNPGSGIVQIENLLSFSRVEIFSSTGELLSIYEFNYGQNKIVLDLSNKPKGLYLLRFISGTSSATAKYLLE
ncbi:MAG: PKD domain-containing protein [Bacteroidales bacterium]|nr:PKD domain-containing protein [Bacteroidales bacterium]